MQNVYLLPNDARGDACQLLENRGNPRNDSNSIKNLCDFVKIWLITGEDSLKSLGLELKNE